MDETKYKAILEGNLFQSARRLRLGWKFQHLTTISIERYYDVHV